MIFRQILATSIAFASFIASAEAQNCNFDKINFGINQEQLKSEFKFEALDVANTGESVIPVGAPEICKDLPETTVLEFMLINDKLVQVSIVNEDTSHALFAYATKIFGEMDNKDTDNKKVTKPEDVKLGLWANNNDYNVMYKSYTAGKNKMEKILVASKQHKDLFSSANETKTKAADDYLKANSLGKYSNTSRDKVEFDNPTKAKDKDDNGIKEPKKHKLKENEHGRGYHYETKE